MFYCHRAMWLDHGSAAYTTPVAAVALRVCVSGLVAFAMGSSDEIGKWMCIEVSKWVITCQRKL